MVYAWTMSKHNQVEAVVSLLQIEEKQFNFMLGRGLVGSLSAIPLMAVTILALIDSTASVFLSPGFLIPELSLAGVAVPLFLLGHKADKAFKKASQEKKNKDKGRAAEMRLHFKEQYKLNLSDEQMLTLVEWGTVQETFEDKTVDYRMTYSDQNEEFLVVTESFKKTLPTSQNPHQLTTGEEKTNPAKETVLPVALFN